MNRGYEDIRSRLGEPLWWDEQCVPRYDPFTPRLMGVYDNWVCLYEIACQNCGQEFKVAESWRIFDLKEGKRREEVTADEVAALHFGDPPAHGCIGDTMNCDDLRVLEFWHRNEDFEWVRLPALEIALQDSGAVIPSAS